MFLPFTGFETLVSAGGDASTAATAGSADAHSSALAHATTGLSADSGSSDAPTSSLSTSNPQVSAYNYNTGPQPQPANSQVSTYSYNTGAQPHAPNDQVSAYNYNTGAQPQPANAQISAYNYNTGAQPHAPNAQISAYNYNTGAQPVPANAQISAYNYNTVPQPVPANAQISAYNYNTGAHTQLAAFPSASTATDKGAESVRASPGHLLLCSHAVLAGLVSATGRFLETGHAEAWAGDFAADAKAAAGAVSPLSAFILAEHVLPAAARPAAEI